MMYNHDHINVPIDNSEATGNWGILCTYLTLAMMGGGCCTCEKVTMRPFVLFTAMGLVAVLRLVYIVCGI